MSCPALTNKGGKLYISEEPVDCDLTLSELSVLPYVLVPGVGSIGDTGIEQDIVTYPTMGSGLTAQGKGDATGRNWDIEILDRPSQAMDILREASASTNYDSYATRIEWANGDVEFSIVQVTSPTYVKGAGSGVRVLRYTMVPSFVPIVADTSQFTIQSIALFGAMSPAPNDYQKAAIDNFMRNGLLPIWDKVDAFYVYHSYAEQPSLLNWKNPAESAIPVNSPVFTPFLGWSGDGVAAHLIIPTAFSAYTQNDAHWGASQASSVGPVSSNWSFADSSTASGNRRAGFAARGPTDNAALWLNSSVTGSQTPITSQMETDLVVVTRDNGVDYDIYRNGAFSETISQGASGLPVHPLMSLRWNSAYGVGTQNILCFGGSLTPEENDLLNAAWDAYKSEMRAPINVFLLAGQSNSEGRDPIANGPAWIQDGLVDGVQAWNGASFSPYDLGDTGASGTGASFVTGGNANLYSFSHLALKTVAESLDNVVVCQVTEGGTGIYPGANTNGCWNADYGLIPVGTPALLEALENRFLDMVSYCADNNIQVNIRGLLWHQGERDDSFPDAEGYQSRFQAVINKVREFTGVPDLPVYFGTISHASSRYNATIEAAQLAVAAADQNCWCRDNSSETLLPDGLHFNATANASIAPDLAAKILEGEI